MRTRDRIDMLGDAPPVIAVITFPKIEIEFASGRRLVREAHFWADQTGAHISGVFRPQARDAKMVEITPDPCDHAKFFREMLFGL